jgi:TRAP-type C4-dicarboxylate transport system permease small subunit
MNGLIRHLDRLVGAAAWIAGVMTVFMMLLVTADVAGRALFNHPIAGTVEIASAYCMTALAFLPLALITRERGHVVVGLFTARMKPRWRTLLDGIVAVVTLIYTATFTWRAIEIAIRKTGIREANEAGIGLVEIWPARWLVVAGFALMTLSVFVLMWRDLRAVLSGEAKKSEGRT